MNPSREESSSEEGSKHGSETESSIVPRSSPSLPDALTSWSAHTDWDKSEGSAGRYIRDHHPLDAFWTRAPYPRMRHRVWLQGGADNGPPSYKRSRAMSQLVEMGRLYCWAGSETCLGRHTLEAYCQGFSQFQAMFWWAVVCSHIWPILIDNTLM